MRSIRARKQAVAVRIITAFFQMICLGLLGAFALVVSSRDVPLAGDSKSTRNSQPGKIGQSGVSCRGRAVNTMAQKGIVKQLFQNFVNSLRRRPPPKMAGEDTLGNKYFEYIPDEKSEERHRRWFVPLNKSRFDQEVPVQWEAWLRFRRVDPPTPEEVEQSRQIQAQTIEKARKIKERRQLETAKPQGAFPSLPGLQKVPGEGRIRESKTLDPLPKK
ncbi:mimitin [Tropilaelaps mercedesae]|uniref:Mimitin n=1 Tax=Tropilaelaps mercedesae TaxID=418985 RepID=A0A1V9XMP1_9ACAR|nr:mimitin [Tropilaelaps mercedesae]